MNSYTILFTSIINLITVNRHSLLFGFLLNFRIRLTDKHISRLVPANHFIMDCVSKGRKKHSTLIIGIECYSIVTLMPLYVLRNVKEQQTRHH